MPLASISRMVSAARRLMFDLLREKVSTLSSKLMAAHADALAASFALVAHCGGLSVAAPSGAILKE